MPKSTRNRHHVFRRKCRSVFIKPAQADVHVKDVSSYATLNDTLGNMLAGTSMGCLDGTIQNSVGSTPQADESDSYIVNLGQMRRRPFTRLGHGLPVGTVTLVGQMEMNVEKTGEVKQKSNPRALTISGACATQDLASTEPGRMHPKEKQTSSEANPISFKSGRNTIDTTEDKDNACTAYTVNPAAAMPPVQMKVTINKGGDFSGTGISLQERNTFPDREKAKFPPLLVRDLKTGLHTSDNAEPELLSPDGMVIYNEDDFNLFIHTPQSDVTIWDRRIDEYYSFPCQLFLQCIDKEKFSFWYTPEVGRIQLICNIIPLLERRKPKPSSTFRTSYMGAEVHHDESGGIIVKADDGIHIETNWHPTKHSRSSWGWILNVWTPIPVSLFDKAESRLFKMKAAVRIGSDPTRKVLTTELNFSVSVLLRNEYMV